MAYTLIWKDALDTELLIRLPLVLQVGSLCYWKFAESLKMVPKTIAEYAGLNAVDVISSLYAEHANGIVKVSINLEEGTRKDVSAMNVWDLYITKLAAYPTFHTCLLWLDHTNCSIYWN